MITIPLSSQVSPNSEIGHLTGLCSPLIPDEEQHASPIDLLTCYLREIDRYPLLTPAEERLLLAQVAQGDQHARTRLIEANLRLVVSIAKRYQGHHPHEQHMSLLDLIQVGNLGLIRAVQQYDPTRGTRFATCAVLYIKAAILRALEEQGRLIRLSSYRLAKARYLHQQREDLARQLGRVPSCAELAVHTNLHLTEVEQTLAADQPILSLHTLLHAEALDDQSFLDILVDEQAPDPAQIVCDHEEREARHQAVQALLSCLTSREREVVCLRFGLDGNGERTTLAVCQELEMCQSRVYQLLTSALSKLRTSAHAHVLRQAFLDQQHAS